MLFAIRIVRSPQFLTMFPDPFVITLDAAYQRYDPPCDVIVFGDSTAVTGVDPRVIQGATGLQTCNLSAPAPVSTALDTKTVDAYLATHTKPKVLVVQMNPDGLWAHATDWGAIVGFYPEAILLRHHPGLETDWALLTHPVHTFVFLESVLQERAFPSRTKMEKFHNDYAVALDQYRESRGLMTLATPAETHCTGRPMKGKIFMGKPDAVWIQKLHQKYEAQGIPVLLRVADIPSCDANADVFAQAYGPITDDPVKVLPITSFNEVDRHYTVEGARQNSLEIADMIRAHGIK